MTKPSDRDVDFTGNLEKPKAVEVERPFRKSDFQRVAISVLIKRNLNEAKSLPMQTRVALKRVEDYDVKMSTRKYGEMSKLKPGSPLSRLSTTRETFSSIKFGIVEDLPIPTVHCNADYQPNGHSPLSSTNKLVSGKIGLPNHKDVADCSTPHPLKTEEIPTVVADFRKAARNAINAGFGGVELHGAHGYLIDQFMKDNVNNMID
ncbi:hypothetical protein KI387_015249 [Taxus chinensis]|uniref:NADH:flavin oxidoreductase/NADH oxidase N-terminal domain-containing protein n=1 Tax=Taxus chinensis TaxID=29808 RepID=A0AA38GFE1_TAXCH|nr:hypothetical protein KI387_015249 [Taxus chinensis]